jgi:DNA-binding NarL/FixJ family response regulator
MAYVRPPTPVGTAPTEREIEVAQLVAMGHSNKVIGKRLYLSEDTVKTHLRHLSARLGTKSRAHTVMVLLRRGLIR